MRRPRSWHFFQGWGPVSTSPTCIWWLRYVGLSNQPTFRTLHKASHPWIPYPELVHTHPSISLCFTTTRPILIQPQAHIAPMCQVRHSPIHLPRIAAIIIWLNGWAFILLRMPSTAWAYTPQLPFQHSFSFDVWRCVSHHVGQIVGSSPVHIHVHVGQ